MTLIAVRTVATTEITAAPMTVPAIPSRLATRLPTMAATAPANTWVRLSCTRADPVSSSSIASIVSARPADVPGKRRPVCVVSGLRLTDARRSRGKDGMDSHPPRVDNLRLLGVSDDGSRLMLEGSDGTPYALPLDERVHAALRGDRARLGQLQIELENQLTPREIQARIRAGQTAEEIAISAQVPVERVRRFEGPVIQERWHIADLAQSTNVRRVTDSSAHPLSDLVLERLAARGVEPEDMSWDAAPAGGRPLGRAPGLPARGPRTFGDVAVRPPTPHARAPRRGSRLADGRRASRARARALPARPHQAGRSAEHPPVPAEEPEPVPSPPRLSAVPDVDEAPDRVEDASFDAFEDADVDVDLPDDQPDVDVVDEPAREPDVLCGRRRATPGALGEAGVGPELGRDPLRRAGSARGLGGSLPQGHGPTRVADPVAPRPEVQRGRRCRRERGRRRGRRP